jgi:hypothetical protein
LPADQANGADQAGFLRRFMRLAIRYFSSEEKLPARGFEAEGDRAALEIARGLCRSAEWSGNGFELRQGARCIHTELDRPGGDA